MADLVSEIRFIPIKQNGSHFGFVDFLYDGNILLKDIAVHKKREGGYRLVYPKHRISEREYVRPQNKETQQTIDASVTTFIQENGYGE